MVPYMCVNRCVLLQDICEWWDLLENHFKHGQDLQHTTAKYQNLIGTTAGGNRPG